VQTAFRRQRCAQVLGPAAVPWLAMVLRLTVVLRPSPVLWPAVVPRAAHSAAREASAR
jgi:hypothetical protein